jgi:predicted TIM-barrel enzyme
MMPQMTSRALLADESARRRCHGVRVLDTAAAAGADVVAHMGFTTKGQIGAATALTIEAAAARVQAIRDAAVSVKPGIIALCHGGPIAEPDDAQYVLDHTTGVAGFFGASSMERLPTEVAITEKMRRFKRITRTAGLPADQVARDGDRARSRS